MSFPEQRARESRPRSYNHLLGVLRRLFNWMVDQETLDHLTGAAAAASRDDATYSHTSSICRAPAGSSRSPQRCRTTTKRDSAARPMQ